jgi:hypothetical protein
VRNSNHYAASFEEGIDTYRAWALRDLQQSEVGTVFALVAIEHRLGQIVALLDEANQIAAAAVGELAERNAP